MHQIFRNCSVFSQGNVNIRFGKSGPYAHFLQDSGVGISKVKKNGITVQYESLENFAREQCHCTFESKLIIDAAFKLINLFIPGPHTIFRYVTHRSLLGPLSRSVISSETSIELKP